MIHWTGKGYLVLAVPLATAVAGMAANEFIFHGNLSNQQINGPALALSALILQYLVCRFPSLQMTEEQGSAREKDMHEPHFVMIKPMSEQIAEFVRARRHAPHTFVWVPLSVWPVVLGAIAIAQLIALI